MKLDSFTRLLTYQGIPVWRNVRFLQAALQVVSAALVVATLAFIVSNVLSAADKRGLSLGFDFLGQEAGFPISESIIGYEESNSFLRAFMVGVLNMLKVSLIGIVLATALGIFIGASRLSSNWLVSKIAGLYIETIRNVPLLVQLFFWYFAVFQALPEVQSSIKWPGPVYLSNRGIFITSLSPSDHFAEWMIFLAGGIIAGVLLWLALKRVRRAGIQPAISLTLPVAVAILLPTLGWFVLGGNPLTRDVPTLGRFNFEGGLTLTPEFAALLLGLVIYTASFIAEIVRAGIQSVLRGQVEASKALGLSDLQALRHVVFPQALKVIIPPLISQYLNLTKNSSLALVIGYPDVFAVGRIMINQAGRAVPVFLLIMLAYLVMSLTYAAIGNLYNRHLRRAG